MKNSSIKWQLTGTFLAVFIAVIMYLIVTSGSNNPVTQVVEVPPAFGKNNYNVMKIDTFVALAVEAYGNLLEHKRKGDLLELDIKNAHTLSADFFNGNSELLKFRLSDHGFEIKYDSEEQSLIALFKVNTQQGINVPNDVLIKIMDKTNKIKDVDNKK